jgi:hypothetical protein
MYYVFVEHDTQIVKVREEKPECEDEDTYSTSDWNEGRSYAKELAERWDYWVSYCN